MRRIDIDPEDLSSVDGLSTREAARVLGVSHSVIARARQRGPRPMPSLFLRNEKPLVLNDVGTTGVVGDIHAPFTRSDYLPFCGDVFSAWGFDLPVFIGDVIDDAAISYHEHDPDGMSPGDEFAMAMDMMREWYKAFPEAVWILGNHDKLPARKIFSAGLPAHFLRDNLYETPPGWKVVESAVIDGVLYVHGGGRYASGQYGHRHLAQRRAQSCVIGHNHYYGGTYYMPLSDGRKIFGMQVGAGYDHHSYAMRYCKDDGPPMVGCGIVVDGERGYFEAM